MAHEIEGTKMAYAKANGVPWHGIGTELDEAHLTAEDFIHAADLDTIVKKRALVAKWIDEDGKQKQMAIPGKYANIRVEDGVFLGIVDEDYTVLQNATAFEIIVDALSQLGEDVEFESAGSLFGGKQMFLAARLKELRTVAELPDGRPDQLYSYLMLRTGHDGGTALDVLPTSVRPVCNNTVNLAFGNRAESGAGYGIRMWHNQSNEAELKRQATIAVATSLKQLDAYAHRAEQLAAVEATEKMLHDIFNVVLPPIGDIELVTPGRRTPGVVLVDGGYIDVRASDKVEKATADRLDKLEIFKDVAGEEADTAWGIFQTATGFVDHARPGSWAKPEARFRSLLFEGGHAMKARAYIKMLELVPAKV